MKKNYCKKGCGVTLFIAIVIAALIRCFLFSSYRINSSDMEDTLLNGDYLIVSKCSYGIRLPQTWFSVPLLHDSIRFLNLKSYHSFASLPYRRIGKLSMQRNDVVCYNNPKPKEWEIPIDKRKIKLNRCIGLPGDTLAITFEEGKQTFSINRERLVESPFTKNFYACSTTCFKDVKEIVRMYHKGELETYQSKDDSLTYFLLNKIEYYKMREEFPKDYPLSLFSLQMDTIDTNIIIPYQGMKIDLNLENRKKYAALICHYEPLSKVELRDDELYIKDKKIASYTFQYNYYWVFSDNRNTFNDSQVVGMIPESHIIGKALRIWNSVDEEKSFFHSFRWNRFFKSVE